MSARAIRALRGSDQFLLHGDDDEEEDDESSAEDTKPSSAFAAMMDSDDDSSSDDDESNSESEKDEGATDEGQKELQSSDDSGREPRNESALTNKADNATVKEKPSPQVVKTPEEEGEEDLDTLLNEFRKQDVQEEPETAHTSDSAFLPLFGPKTHARDLDVDSAMRNALLADNTTDSRPASRGSRQSFLFGPPRENWPRPPHYVGGGMGMQSYQQTPRPLPWPYSDISNQTENKDLINLFSNPKNWYTFVRAEGCLRDYEDYKIIQQSGDLNALVMFVAHHPYVTDALLQVANVLYQTNHTQEGMALLRRCLWVYECSALRSFNASVMDSKAMLDMDQPENETFFRALFRLIQASNISGLPRTASGVCRYLLALDPLRDPLNVVAVMDAFTVLSKSDALDQWILDTANSQLMSIQYRDNENPLRTFQCSLRDLPNWMLSLSLAEFRAHGRENGNFDSLRRVIQQFPEVVDKILQALEVDTAGRSFRRDWPTLLEQVPERTNQIRRSWSQDRGELELHEVNRVMETADKILDIYVRMTAKLWGEEPVLQLLYDTLKSVLQSSSGETSPPMPPAALMRYSSLNPKDYETRIDLLPQDANIMDPGMVAHAIAVVPNRPRFLRQMPRGGAGNLPPQFGQNVQQHGPPTLLGRPTNMVDPDWPLVEVLWRSFLPWNEVEGIPPPPV